MSPFSDYIYAHPKSYYSPSTWLCIYTLEKVYLQHDNIDTVSLYVDLLGFWLENQGLLKHLCIQKPQLQFIFTYSTLTKTKCFISEVHRLLQEISKTLIRNYM